MNNSQHKVIISALGLMTLALLGCGDGGRDKIIVQDTGSINTNIAEEESVPVELAVVRRVQIEKTVFASGTITAKQTSNIGPLVEGVIEKIFVKVGDRVKLGDPLFQTRKVDFERRVDEAKAAMNLANIRGVQAKRNYDRAKELASQENISQARLDDVETSFQIAGAEKLQAKAALETAEQQLADTVVHAPFDGVITARNVDEGVYLSNRFSMGGSSAVVRIQEISIVAAIVQTPEENLGLLALNQPAKVQIQGHEEGYDSFVYILNDLVDPQTRTVELRLPIRNEDYAIKPGQFAEARIILPPQELLVIPRSAIVSVGNTIFVFVIQNNVVNRIAVEAREFDTEHMEIVNGLQEGDSIVLSPPDTLKNGERLRRRLASGAN